MKWNNALKDNLPPHQEEVLISVNGIYYYGIFHADKKAFEAELELEKQQFKVGEHVIYWTSVQKPHDNSHVISL
jgi:hypothetical protein